MLDELLREGMEVDGSDFIARERQFKELFEVCYKHNGIEEMLEEGEWGHDE